MSETRHKLFHDVRSLKCIMWIPFTAVFAVVFNFLVIASLNICFLVYAVAVTAVMSGFMVTV